MNEPIGVMGLIAPTEAPLLGFLSLVLPAIAMGNCVVAVPSEKWPLLATDLYQVFDTSDVPAGVINIVTGGRRELAPVLAAHDDVDSVWFYGPREEGAEVEKLSAGNMKRTHVVWDAVDWLDRHEAGGRRVPPRGDPGEEYLGAVRRLRLRRTPRPNVIGHWHPVRNEMGVSPGDSLRCCG